MKFRKALNGDLKQLESILKKSKLPYEDCKYHLNNFVLMESDKEIVAIGGSEMFGDIALLRSITVLKQYQGNGLGNSIFFKIKKDLIVRGVKTIYLLTETAEEYFRALGFEQTSRDIVPQQIKKTKQFSTLCPSSAVVMKCGVQ